MDETADSNREAQLVFEYAKGPFFRSLYADGFIGGLTPSGHLHIAFFSERPTLPRRHVYRVNPDGSLGPEIPDEKAAREPIVRDMQVDVLMTMHAAESLRNWLDQYIRNLKSRISSKPTGEMKASVVPIVQN
jgi:hypothetical protein